MSTGGAEQVRLFSFNAPLFEKLTPFVPGRELNPLKARICQYDMGFLFGGLFPARTTGGAYASTFEWVLSRRWNVLTQNVYTVVVHDHPADPDSAASYFEGQSGDGVLARWVYDPMRIFGRLIEADAEPVHVFPGIIVGNPGILGVSPQATEVLGDTDNEGDIVPRSSAKRALEVAEQLRAFFGLSDESLGDLVDIGRTTIASWRGKQQRQPRASTIAPLLDLGALVASLRDRLGNDEARVWFMNGRPSRFERLKLDRRNLYREADEIIFSQVVRRTERGIVGPVVDVELKTGATPRPALNRVVRTRVDGRDRRSS